MKTLYVNAVLLLLLGLVISGCDVTDSEENHEEHIVSFDEVYDNELILNFSPKIPLDFSLDFGVVKGDMDMTL